MDKIITVIFFLMNFKSNVYYLAYDVHIHSTLRKKLKKNMKTNYNLQSFQN